MDRTSISLVIPARNEEALLPRLLETVAVARKRFHGGVDQVEVIVADNVSTDSTADIARAAGCRVAQVEKRCIAAVRNGGAAIAKGDIVAFVDADTQIHPETFNAIADVMADGRYVAAASGVKLERWSVGLAVTYLCLLPMLWITKLDTGVVFCRREDFERVGGYEEQLQFAEDVRFLWDLRRLGKTRGQRLTRVRWAKAVASTRKFDSWGDWHYFKMLAHVGRSLLRRDSESDQFALKYWYNR
ncbi:MAG: glycosyltransferase [bacterium]|nr:glycosyltransferase [bacterium]